MANPGLQLRAETHDAETLTSPQDEARVFYTRESDLLVEGLRAGSNWAYEQLLADYQHQVYSLVYRLLSDPSEAPDIVQEVFLKIFRNIGHFRGQSSLRTWIYRIAVNEAHNQRRWFSRHRQQEVGFGAADEGVPAYEDVMAARGRSPLDLACDTETRRTVEEALQELNPVFRSVLVLREMEELSYEEIATILDISLGTVKSRILRGREALRRKLVGRIEPAPSWQWSPEPVEGQP